MVRFTKTGYHHMFSMPETVCVCVCVCVCVKVCTDTQHCCSLEVIRGSWKQLFPCLAGTRQQMRAG